MHPSCKRTGYLSTQMGRGTTNDGALPVRGILEEFHRRRVWCLMISNSATLCCLGFLFAGLLSVPKERFLGIRTFGCTRYYERVPGQRSFRKAEFAYYKN